MLPKKRKRGSSAVFSKVLLIDLIFGWSGRRRSEQVPRASATSPACRRPHRCGRSRRRLSAAMPRRRTRRPGADDGDVVGTVVWPHARAFCSCPEWPGNGCAAVARCTGPMMLDADHGNSR
ncbi:hypothetical protein BZL30_1145 [Mycobacterium kansasii]|uniref:Uncharacterized protein n=1 Tax=Mycobacterium kansasii TaxID=1768 RepID=A0A1V3XWI2_MYCKA|nr:hypothetical protein BZL30_1145 [Mycobacterium kansasii]